MGSDLYKSILYNSPNGYAYHRILFNQVGKAIDYEVLEINPAFEILTGLKAQEIVGKPITRVLPDVRNGSVDWVEFFADLALKGGSREYTHYWEPLDIWFRVKAFSFQKGYFVIYISDISREVQQIQELDTIFKVSPGGICILDRKGRILKVNKALAKLLGIAPNELVGQVYLDFIHEEDRKFAGEILANLLFDGNEANFVSRLRSYEEGCRYIDWRCLVDGGRIFMAARDITDRIEEQEVTDKLVECSEEFLQLTAADFEYQKIVDYLKDIAGAAYAGFRLFDPETGQFKTVASAGEAINTAVFDHKPARYRTDGNVVTVYPGSELMFRAAVAEVALEHLGHDFAAGEAVLAKLSVNGRLIGDFTLLMPPGKPFKHKSAVEIFTRQVGLLIARTQAEKEVSTQKAYFEALFLNTTDAMLYFDEEARVYKINEQFTELFGYRQEEIQGVKIHSVFLSTEEHELLAHRILSGETVFIETVRKAKSGKGIPVYVKGGPVYIDGKIKGGYAVYTDISERKAYEEQLKHLSLHDQLTGLYNRNFFETQIKVIEKSKRYPISLIIFDVDGLKLVNDTLGHSQGDQLLQLAADIISRSLRGSDFLARIGGDEFVAILPETDEETARKIVKRIRENIAKANEEKRPFPVSISIGTATAFNHETSLQETLKKADERMYHEKLVEKKATRSEMLAFLLNALAELKRPD